jgi:hypothetical protein
LWRRFPFPVLPSSRDVAELAADAAPAPKASAALPLRQLMSSAGGATHLCLTEIAYYEKRYYRLFTTTLGAS